VHERLKTAGAGHEPIFSPKALEVIHLYSLGIPRVVNLLCEHSLVNAFVENQRPIEAKIVEDVAREFQLDEVEPIAPAGSSSLEADVLSSEAFIQNLGEALSRFRVGPPLPRTRK
ncbi:MAG: hypothetical protein WB556_18545, partial [Candidatus Acidiferrum sp.]